MVENKNFHNQIVGPAVAVDNVLFTIRDKTLQVLLIQISTGPYKDNWALPGGLVKENENVDSAAFRVLQNKANVTDLYLEQLYTFGKPERDVRGHVISVAYFSIINDSDKLDLKTLPYYKEIKWFNIKELPNLAFDHKEIINFAVNRLISKLDYTNIAYNFLPPEFTFTQLQSVYETVLGKALDKRNFRKKIDSLNIIEKAGSIERNVPYRPASLYKFKRRYLELIS